MSDNTNLDNSNSTEMEGIAKDSSNFTQIGSIRADKLFIGNESATPLLKRIEVTSKDESVGILKTGDIPKSLDYWQGRVEEISQLHQWLADDNIRLIGIEGIGGTGKSMLATKIHEEIEGFPKRFWADVSSGATIFSDLARRVLTDFGDPVPDDELQLVNALVQCLRSGQYLLIIDNLETLLDLERKWKSQFYDEFFRTWIEYGKGSKILVTTRERPDLRGFPWLSLKGLKIEDGVSLLQELGIQGELSAFVELVDGHPLLLKIVANLIQDEYPQDPNLRRLADLGLGNLRELLTDSRVVGSHRTENVGMVLVLDASFERLADWQKIWLQNLSVFRVAFDAEAAIAMLPKFDDLSFDKNEAEQELRKFVKRSFLEEKLNPQRQFSFQPVVLEYLRYKAGEQTEAHMQAINYYYQARTKEKSSWQTIGDLKEYLEIFYHLCELGEYDYAFDAIRHCDYFLTLQGYYTIRVELYEQLVAAWQQADARENWKFTASLIGLGNAYYSLGQYQAAIDFYRQSLEITRDIGDRKGEANSLGNLGNAYNSLGQYQAAIDFHRQSLEITRDIGDRKGEANSLGNLGNAYNSLGQYPAAIDFYRQSLEITRDIGDRNGEATSLNNLGNVYDSLGQYQAAIDFHRQSLEITRDIGDRNGEATSLNNLGNVYDSLGQYQAAIDFHRQSLEITRDIGDRKGEATSLQNLANAYSQCGRVQEGFAASYQAQQILQELELPLEAMPYPKWMKSLIKYAQRGKFQLFLCFIFGLIAFPFVLVLIIISILWRLTRRLLRR